MPVGIPISADEADKLKVEIVSILAEGTGRTFTEACERAGVARSVVYEWRDADPAFDEQVTAAMRRSMSNLVDLAENSAAHLIKERNVPMTIFTLKCHGKKRGWQENTVIVGDKSCDAVQTALEVTLKLGDNEESIRED